MKLDKVEEIEGSIIQHGDLNDRVYLMKLNKKKSELAVSEIDELAKKNSYGKVFAKVPGSQRQIFLANGYRVEAQVPGLYKGSDTALFMAKYFDEKRSIVNNSDELKKVLKIARNKETQKYKRKKSITELNESHAEEMASIYGQVFESYPFPIEDPNFLVDNMNNHVDYYGVFEGQKLVSISSAEKDPHSKSVEMTDFATLPKFRGNGHAYELLGHMDNDMKIKGYETLYTIARACSVSMNVTFSKAGYQYSGTLNNNTNIGGSIESMNIWYKK